MDKNIEHYVFHKENFLDKKYCEDCIDELDKHTWDKHTWYNEAHEPKEFTLQGQDEPEMLGPGGRFHVEEVNAFIIEKLHSVILEYIESFNFDWFDEWVGYSTLRFTRYFQGQRMKNHCDHIRTLFDGKIKGIPILSIIGILNDDYEGGELIMFKDKKIDTKTGDMFIFPSNFLYPHEITPVTKGVRYSYVSWVW